MSIPVNPGGPGDKVRGTPKRPGRPIFVSASGNDGAAVFALSDGPTAIVGSHVAGGIGVFAESPFGVAIHAKGSAAAVFEGGVGVTGGDLTVRGGDIHVNNNIEVGGNINLTGVTSDITLRNEDCAEQFNVFNGKATEPGMVMVLDDEGLLRPSQLAYDRRVAGVISGAGDFRSAVTLGVVRTTQDRVPIALLGKVYCWADADAHPIKVGDLLTSSSTEGHAMVASEPTRAFGSIIGKALKPLASGRGLIPILVALQ